MNILMEEQFSIATMAGGVICYTTGIDNYDWLLNEESQGIDMRIVEHDAKCTERDHADCDYSLWHDTVYMGGWYLINGELLLNRAAEYSAILDTSTAEIQVVHSHWMMPARRCSPCFPHQNNLEEPDSEYGMPTYCLPPHVLIPSLRHFVTPC